MLRVFLGIFLVAAVVSVYFNIRQGMSPTKELFGMGKEMITEMRKDSIDIYSMIVSVIILAVMMSPFLVFTVALDIVVFLTVLCAEAEIFLMPKPTEIKK